LPTSPRAVVVVTGSELVRGDRGDANGPFLATELSGRGLDPARILLVGDRPEELTGALAEGVEADFCLVSGGLGPTHDDRTVETLATVTGRSLVVDEELEREIERVSRGVAERLGRPYADFSAGVTKQASLPQGAVSLGLAGTAPALLLEHDRSVIVLLPGPPTELRRLWANALEHPAVKGVFARAPTRVHRVLRFFGPSESAVASSLAEAGGELDGLEVTVCAHDLEIHVDIFAEAGAETRAGDLDEALTASFPDSLFAVDDERAVEELVLESSRVAGLKLATAESCTGGLVGARLTDVPGASQAYLGGVIAYSDEAKRTELDVAEKILLDHGAVSEETAAAMAGGARRRFGADVAVAVTGIAGPGGGTPEKPVGLVFISVESPEGASTRRFELPGDRVAVRSRATGLALHMLRRVLAQSGTPARTGGS
jgi:competence/damage-inducible protein CinA-like protein